MQVDQEMLFEIILVSAHQDKVYIWQLTNPLGRQLP